MIKRAATVDAVRKDEDMRNAEQHAAVILDEHWYMLHSSPPPFNAANMAYALHKAGLLAESTTPPEPPIGTKLLGACESNVRNVWVRFHTGWRSADGTRTWTWTEALHQGADPARPLVELVNQKGYDDAVMSLSQAFDRLKQMSQVRK